MDIEMYNDVIGIIEENYYHFTGDIEEATAKSFLDITKKSNSAWINMRKTIPTQKKDAIREGSKRANTYGPSLLTLDEDAKRLGRPLHLLFKKYGWVSGEIYSDYPNPLEVMRTNIKRTHALNIRKRGDADSSVNTELFRGVIGKNRSQGKNAPKKSVPSLWTFLEGISEEDASIPIEQWFSRRKDVIYDDEKKVIDAVRIYMKPGDVLLGRADQLKWYAGESDDFGDTRFQCEEYELRINRQLSPLLFPIKENDLIMIFKSAEKFDEHWDLTVALNLTKIVRTKFDYRKSLQSFLEGQYHMRTLFVSYWDETAKKIIATVLKASDIDERTYPQLPSDFTRLYETSAYPACRTIYVQQFSYWTYWKDNCKGNPTEFADIICRHKEQQKRKFSEKRIYLAASSDSKHRFAFLKVVEEGVAIYLSDQSVGDTPFMVIPTREIADSFCDRFYKEMTDFHNATRRSSIPSGYDVTLYWNHFKTLVEAGAILLIMNFTVCPDKDLELQNMYWTVGEQHIAYLRKVYKGSDYPNENDEPWKGETYDYI